jgi:hypothetical protein
MGIIADVTTNTPESSSKYRYTDKERLFIGYYVQTLNAHKAARMAGYVFNSDQAFPYKKKNLPKMKVAIQELLDATYLDAPEVRSRLSSYARAEYADYLKDDGTVDLFQLLADGKGHLIKSIKPSQHGHIIEFYDAQVALTTLAKITGLLRDRMEVSGPDGGPMRTETVVKPDLSKLTDEELDRLETILTKATTDNNDSGLAPVPG